MGLHGTGTVSAMAECGLTSGGTHIGKLLTGRCVIGGVSRMLLLGEGADERGKESCESEIRQC